MSRMQTMSAVAAGIGVGVGLCIVAQKVLASLAPQKNEKPKPIPYRKAPSNAERADEIAHHQSMLVNEQISQFVDDWYSKN